MPKSQPGNTSALKYEEKYIEEVDRYLKKNKDRNVKFLKQRSTEDKKDKSSVYGNRLKVKLPTIVGFAIYLDVSEKTLYNWADAHSKFKAALSKIKSEQKQRLINSGLSGSYNSTIAKLVLSSNHGMKERVDNTSDDKPINNFNDEQVDRIADRIAGRKGDDGSISSPKKPN